MNTTTPRTDAAYDAWMREYSFSDAFADFARQLERELAEARHIIDCSKTPLMADVLKERGELKARLEKAMKCVEFLKDGRLLNAEETEALRELEEATK